MAPRPALEDLGDDRFELVKIAVRHCLMPHRDVVLALNGPVFPSIRDQRRRMQTDMVDGQKILLDDNVTPRWALLWSHGIKDTGHLNGWTFAHVWPLSKCPKSYTHPANICMMPEFFGSLSDKAGPLSDYLKFHAWAQYNWSPNSVPPTKPDRFDDIAWRYLDPIDTPQIFIQGRMDSLSNQRVKALKEIISFNSSAS
jgi:hypothetical protein